MQHKIITFLIACVWFINGLFCKILNLVPRHELIVSRILGPDYSRELTILIGISEVLMGLWILSAYKKRLNAVLQIVIILIMNIIEFIMASDLLLWGRFNLVFALLLSLLIYFNEFKTPANMNVNV